MNNNTTIFSVLGNCAGVWSGQEHLQRALLGRSQLQRVCLPIWASWHLHTCARTHTQRCTRTYIYIYRSKNLKSIFWNCASRGFTVICKVDFDFRIYYIHFLSEYECWLNPGLPVHMCCSELTVAGIKDMLIKHSLQCVCVRKPEEYMRHEGQLVGFSVLLPPCVPGLRFTWGPSCRDSAAIPPWESCVLELEDGYESSFSYVFLVMIILPAKVVLFRFLKSFSFIRWFLLLSLQKTNGIGSLF